MNSSDNMDHSHRPKSSSTSGMTTTATTKTRNRFNTSENNNNTDEEEGGAGGEAVLDTDALGSYLADYPKLKNINNARRNIKKCFNEIDYFHEIPLLCSRLKDELHSSHGHGRGGDEKKEDLSDSNGKEMSCINGGDCNPNYP